MSDKQECKCHCHKPNHEKTMFCNCKCSHEPSVQNEEQCKCIKNCEQQGYQRGLQEVMDLPVFANKHEREYQIGINEVWKQVKKLAENNS